jgi:4-amino-4-deoxy-L-arabinose transferase-like glycosyltransferase
MPPRALSPDRPPGPSAWRTDLLLFVLGVVLLSFSIWSETSVSGQDEYSLTLRTPMEMLEHGSFVTPVLDDEPRLRKPPLLYWLIAGTYWLFGPSLAAARIWSVLSGALMGVVAARVARLAFGGRVAMRTGPSLGTDEQNEHSGQNAGTTVDPGLLAGLLTLSTIGVGVEARRAMLDLPLAAFTTLAIALGTAWARSGGAPLAIGSALALGGACMIKGPIALAFFGGAFAAGLAIRGLAPLRGRLATVLSCGALALAIAVWWPLLMQAWWPEDWQEAIGGQISDQSLSPLKLLENVGPILGGLFGTSAPWSIVLLFALVAYARPRRSAGDLATRRDDGTRWLWYWIVLGCAPFVFFKTFERYLIPQVVPVAALCAGYLLSIGERARRLHLTIALAVLGVPCAGFSVFALWFGLAWLAPLATLLILVVGLRHAWRTGAPTPAAFAALLLTTLTLGGTYPTLGINDMPDELPGGVVLREEPSIGTFDSPRPAMVSIRAGRSVGQIGEASLQNGWRGIAFVEDVDAERFERVAAANGRTATRLGDFPSLYSRKVWIRFARKDATGADWWQALRERSLAPLSPRFEVWRVE